MYRKKRVILILPVYNEALNLASVLRNIPDFVDLILVIDDGSTDNSIKVALKVLPLTYISYVVIKHKENFGQGFSRATGAYFARTGSIRTDMAVVCGRSPRLNWKPSESDLFCFCDSDGQLDPNDMSKFIDRFVESDLDFVKGTRFHSSEVLKIMPKNRLVGNILLSFLMKIATGYWNLTDPQCGYFLVSARISDQLKWFSLRPRFGQINQILIKLSELNIKTGSVPIKPIYGIGEISKLRIRSMIFPLSKLTIKAFIDRILVRNLILNSHPLAFFYLFGLILIVSSTLLFLSVLFQIMGPGEAPFLRSILIMLLGSLGLLSLFQAIVLDVEEDRNRLNEK
jgi:glycosyltransferase involved in cell wall biosynthesis